MLQMLIWFAIGLQILCWIETSQANSDTHKRQTGLRLPFEKYSFNRFELKHYRDTVKDLFDFAHENYLEKGYPYDELRPISCVPKTRNFSNPDDQITNDVLGNFSVTLVDSLTTLAVMRDSSKFAEMVKLVETTFPNKFDIDSTVQVFETSIRIVGGLISSHLYATDPSKEVYLGGKYNGSLLRLAKDMADRLLPSYLTYTGLPIPRINLRSGYNSISMEVISENNVAAMASPNFEFTMLSYLTLDSKYAEVTRYAVNKTWSLRSELDLLPMSFNPQTGQCYSPISGIGASIDSFYEYALKGALLFNDDGLLKIWQDAYDALNTNARRDWFYGNVQSTTGNLQTLWVDSLSAFFPGLQVLAGDVNDAILKHMLALKLWNTFGGIPERWEFKNILLPDGKDSFTSEDLKSFIPLEWYPLRPEFAESTYFLYRATKDPFYLNVGLNILESLETRFKRECGFGGYEDVTTGEPQDRMETFLLSETLKYLYLLFDMDNELHNTRDNIIFSTEAHPMWLTADMIRNYQQHKYFNDTIYKEHLNHCRKNDRKKLKEQEKSYMGDKLRKFARSLFISDNLDYSEEDLEMHRNSTADPIVNKKFPINGQMCFPPTITTTCHTDKPQWLHSHILAHFDRLFEIDRRYNSTLIRPSHLQNEVPMELQPGFYWKWVSSRISDSHSQLTPSTESLDIIVDLPGECHLIRLSDGTIHISVLGGHIKISLERLEPAGIDVYGNFIDSKIFVKANHKDIFRSSCDKIDDTFTPALVYRVTVINGINLPENANLTINQNAVSSVLNEQLKLFGQNPDNQLMFNCIPIINLHAASLLKTIKA